MFLSVIGAIALAMGSTMTVVDLDAQEASTALNDQTAVVQVAQVVESESNDIGW